jgi:hypothetical protein
MDAAWQRTDREREPEREEPVTAGPTPVSRVLELQRSAGNQAVARLIRARASALQRDSPPATAPPAGSAPAPGRFQGPASAPTPLMRSVLPIASIAQIVAARAAIETMQPGAQVTVALGPAGVPVAQAEQPAALTAIRHALMEGLSGSLADARARGEPEPALMKIARDYLTALRGAAAADRFQHPDQAVRDAVIGALGMEQIERASTEEGAQNSAAPDPTNSSRTLPNAEARARAGGRLAGTDDWCGAFAMSMQRQSGATPDLAGFMQGTEGVISLLTYKAKHWIQVAGAWTDVEGYHDGVRHSRRSWREIDPAAAHHNPRDFDIRAGDIVLIDLARGTRPDHIAMVRSYDPATGSLVTIGGNEGSLHPIHTSGARDIAANPRAVEHPQARRLTDLQRLDAAAKRGERALTDEEKKELADLQKIVPDWDAKNKPSRVFGWGRLSLVDFETHPYRFTPPPPESAPRR